MRERALLIGARFRIDPGDEGGTIVRLRLDGRPWIAPPPQRGDTGAAIGARIERR
jgi:hypothetical protein